MSDTALGELYGEIIEETWGGATMRRPPMRGGQYAPNEVKNQYTAQQVKIGTKMNPMTVNVNPDEQEENVSGSIDKRKLFGIIDSLSNELNSTNNNDRGALIVLGKLKNLINNNGTSKDDKFDQVRFNQSLEIHQLTNELGAIRQDFYNKVYPKVEDIRDFLNRSSPRVDVALEIVEEIERYLKSIK